VQGEDMVAPRDEDEEMGDVDTSQSQFVDDTVHLRDEDEEIASDSNTSQLRSDEDRVDPLRDEDEEMVDPYSNAGYGHADDGDGDTDDGDSVTDDGDSVTDDAESSNAEDADSETLERAEFSDVEDFEDEAGISSGTTLRKRQFAALVCLLFCLSAHR
jgi:hypothetical protein